MTIRVKQPPIQPALRDPERHDFWPGFVCTLIGLIVLLAGARHLTGVETTDGNTAWETQLVKAFSCGGIQYADLTARPPRRGPTDIPDMYPPPEPPSDERASGPVWKIKVNLGAKTPCPT